MDEQRILEELLGLLEAGNVKIRREPLGGGGGGFCTVKGEPTLFLDTEASAGESAAVCAEAVLKTVDIDSIYIRPEVRRFLESRSRHVT